MTKDFLSGVFFTVLGAGVTVISLRYAIGTPQQMGPGLFPSLLGCIVTVIGLIVGVRSLIAGGADDTVTWDLRPLLCVLGAVVVFGVLIERAGLVVSIATMVAVARLGGRKIRPLELVILIVVLVAIATGVFVLGLNLPLHLGFA